MIAIPEVVNNIVKKSPFLSEGLARRIINLSALARLIKPEVEGELMKDVQEGAIMMALRRLMEKIQKKQGKTRIFKSVPDMMVRMNLIEMTYSNSEFFIQKLKRLLEQMASKKNYFLTFTQGVFETTVIASREFKGTILAIFKGEKAISQFDNLSSITVQLPPGTALIPGAYYFLLRALAWEEINVTEVVSTFNEFTIILEEKYIDKAFSILKDLW